MITAAVSPALAVATAFAAGIVILILGNRIGPNVREGITLSASVIMAGFIFSMAPGVAEGLVYSCDLWMIADGIGLSLRADSAGMVFACVAGALWIVTSVYSVGYMRSHHEKNQTGYFAAFAACLGAACGIAFAANLITFFMFFEILTLATYPLVVHYRDDKARFSGRKYLAYTLVSGQLFFAAIVWVYVKYGTCDFAPGGFISPGSSGKGIMCLMFFMMTAAGAVKAGVMPLHGWLPSAMVAPTPVSALLHAVAVVKAGAFCILRVVCYVFGPESASWCMGAPVLCWFAAGTILISSLVAMRQDNLKARLAYSTVGQLSYIVLGICLLSPYSITGALFHIAAHASLKITLFMCAGAIFVTAGLSDISKMKGLARRMPMVCGCFAAASFGIAGMPLMAGFVSKFNILEGAWQQSSALGMTVLLAAALLALNYLVPVINVFFGAGDKKISEICHSPGKGLSLCLTAPLAVTLMIALTLGFFPDAGAGLYDLAQNAAEAVTRQGGFYAGD